jgi:hypothetical protein
VKGRALAPVVAEVTVPGFVHESEGGASSRAVRVALIGHGADAALLVDAAGLGARDGYEVPVSALKAALTALPLKDLFRVVREAKA